MALGNLLDSKSSSMNAAYDRALKFDDKRTTGNNCRYGKLADDAFQEAETWESEVKRIEAKIEQISNAKRVCPDLMAALLGISVIAGEVEEEEDEP